jgi:uncharacterized protein (TIGR02246 family)
MNCHSLNERDQTMIQTDPATVARQILDRLESAWNTADGPAFGSLYSAGASFVTVRGEHFVGRDAIGAGHDEIFHTIYAGSRNRMVLIRADEVADGVVVAVSASTLDCPAGPLAGRHHATSTNVITRPGPGDESWRIVSTQNTLAAAG